MIVIFAPGLRLLGLEEKIPSEHFIHHTSERPDIGSLVIALPQNDLWRSVLSRLNFTGKMMMFPAGITEICDFDLKWKVKFFSPVEFDFSFFNIK